VQVLSEWGNFRRRGRRARNMQPQHAAIANRRGSWGVGQFHFQVRADSGQIFELYYDRAPRKTLTIARAFGYCFRSWQNNKTLSFCFTRESL
jgi:hypothetical protein